MKKIVSSLPFLALTVGGAALVVASVAGIFQSFGIATELALLSLAFASTVLGIYATAKTMAS